MSLILTGEAGTELLRTTPNLRTESSLILGVSDSALRHLRSIQTYELDFISHPFSLASIQHISKVAKVKRLGLLHSTITDEYLPSIATMDLEHLDLRRNAVTETGVTTLAKALPNCRIDWDGGVIEPSDTPAQHRALAELALENGATVTVSLPDRKEFKVTDLADLPVQDFQIDEILGGSVTTQNSQQFGELLRSVEIRFAPGAIRNADQILHDLEGASLQSISMWSSDVTDVGLASLSRSRTQTVDLCFCKSITDDGLSHLVKIPGLREVHLCETPITDDGVRHLSQIEALWRLNLDDTNTTDIGLTALADSADLHELYLRGTKVTEAGVTALSKALPSCYITWDGGVIAPPEGLPRIAKWVLESHGRLFRVAAGDNPNTDAVQVSDPAEFADGKSEISHIYLERDTDLTPDGLRALGQYPGLHTLSIWETQQFSDATLEPLQNLRLQNLLIQNVALTDTGLRRVNLQDLKAIHLTGTKISDAGLEYLADAPNLWTLNVEQTAITDKGLAHFSNHHLHGLTLNHCRGITDEGLKAIKDVYVREGHIASISLVKTKITDVGLSYIQTMKALAVDVRETAVTEAGVTALSKTLPNCRIEWDGGVIEPVRGSQRAAAEWIVGKGGSFAIENGSEFKPGDTLPNAPFKVTGIRLEGSTLNVTERDFLRLKPLVDLQLLGLQSNQTDGNGLKHLSGLTKLNLFMAAFTKVNDAAIAELPDWPLTYVDLQRTPTTDASIARLKRFADLEHLATGRGVTDQGLRQLAEFSALRSLTIGDLNPNISDKTAESIASIKQLNRLTWVKAPITDDGLKHLANLTSLNQLHLIGSSVTEAGVAALSKALPNCRIEWDGGVIEPTSDPDRRAAAWVLSHGGLVDVAPGGRVTSNEELPEGKFAVQSAMLGYTDGKITDDEL